MLGLLPVGADIPCLWLMFLSGVAIQLSLRFSSVFRDRLRFNFVENE